MYEELPPFRVKKSRFRSGERMPIVVDARGIAVYRPNLYGIVALRPRKRSAGTIEAHYRSICIALNWGAERSIDLTSRTDTLELFNSFEIEHLRDALRRNYRQPGRHEPPCGPRVVGTGHYASRCTSVRDYLTWQAEHAIGRIGLEDARLGEARRRLEAFERLMIEGLRFSRGPEGREGLEESAQEQFLELIKPDHPLNPFQKKHRFRNYALLLLYYETSVRRAEALKLKGEHLVGFGGRDPVVRIIRDHDNPDDPRGEEPRAKTQARDVPISLQLSELLVDWLVIRSDVKLYPGSKRTPYVFVSRDGKPLGLRTVNGMFDLLRKRINTLPRDLTPHILRHTGNDRFSEGADQLGLTEAEEKQARNYHMGWATDSNQGDRYTKRHTRRRAAAIIKSMQEKSVQGRNR